MSSAATLTTRRTNATSWSGRALAVFVILFLVFDGTIHVLVPTPVVDAFAQLGIPLHLSVGIGSLEFVCIVLFAIPRTSLLGALLLTAYLGGATAIQVRAEAAWFPTIFAGLVGVLLWASVLLRDARVRALVLSPSRNR
jgi:hypothetical protein